MSLLIDEFSCQVVPSPTGLYFIAWLHEAGD